MDSGVAPTLNAMDNNGEASATVLVVAVDGYNQTISNVNQTLRVGSDLDKMGMVLIIDGTRVDDVRVYEDGIVPTVISRYGTGGGNVPMIQKQDGSVVRRLTPIECERLQGFPDDWTSGQADSNRYKQMGNAVAVPVAEWIISRMVGEDD